MTSARFLSRLVEWTHQYGAALCPGSHADTFGEGMRAAKDQVSVLLATLPRDASQGGGTAEMTWDASTVVPWCPQCGPEPRCDEDGCCATCGATCGEVPDWRQARVGGSGRW